MNLRLVERWLQWSPFRGSGSACKFISVSLLFAVQPPLHFQFPVVRHSVRKTRHELQTALYDIHRCLAMDRGKSPFFQRMLVVDVLIYFEFKCVSPTNVPNKLIYWYITNSPYVGGCYNDILTIEYTCPNLHCHRRRTIMMWFWRTGSAAPNPAGIDNEDLDTAISNLMSPRNHPPKKWFELKESHVVNEWKRWNTWKPTKSHEKPC